MQYILTFLEGIISFISPCCLPLLPVYISYFAANKNNTHYTLLRTFFFVLGFTIIFVTLGVFAGTIGQIFIIYKKIINIICGIIVIIFGLSYLDIFHLPFFKGLNNIHISDSLFSAFIFGILYSISLSPCTGAFLGSSLMLASSSANTIKGALLLLFYALGLGIPFILSALLLDYLKDTFDFIKSHYKVITRISGILLIILGILIIFGFL